MYKYGIWLIAHTHSWSSGSVGPIRVSFAVGGLGRPPDAVAMVVVVDGDFAAYDDSVVLQCVPLKAAGFEEFLLWKPWDYGLFIVISFWVELVYWSSFRFHHGW